jgi:hypothetical protein
LQVLAQAVEPAAGQEPLAGETHPAPQLAAEAETHMILSNIWVSEVQVPVGLLAEDGGEALRIESKLRLEDPKAVGLTHDQVPYLVELYLIDTHTNQSTLIDTHFDRLAPDTLDYAIAQEIPLPEAGRYQLFMFARLLPPAIGAAHAQGPVILVEP